MHEMYIFLAHADDIMHVAYWLTSNRGIIEGLRTRVA